MKCIGGCPAESLIETMNRDVRPSQITIQGVSVEVCGGCGEVFYGSRRFERRVLDGRRSRRARRALRKDLLRGDWMEHDRSWNR